MASRKDFEDRYFDHVDENFKDIKEDIKEVKDETKIINRAVQKINSRVGKVEDEVFPRKETLKTLPPLWRDPQILKIVTILGIGFILVLVIYAGLRGIPIPSSLF